MGDENSRSRGRDDPGPHPDDGDLTVDLRSAGSGGVRSAGHTATSSRYLLGETIGEGGMAVVHLATDTNLKRQVAIKRLRPELTHREDARARIRAALRNSEGGNLFGFSEAEHELLRAQLATAEREIEASERGGGVTSNEASTR